MPAIRITGFTGEQPRIIPTLLPGSAAKSAVNVRLDDGGLTPSRQSIGVTSVPDVNRLTIYLWNGTWLSWPTIVHAAPGPVATDRLYYTGDGLPKLRVASSVYDLKLSPPGLALTATLGGTGSGDIISRIYAYTWVTDFGEESEPSPASAAVNWQSGQTVTLSGFAATPAGRNITKQRIYRSQTGQVGTGFYLIAERAASTGNYVDNMAVDAFAEPLPSIDYNVPPDDLEGLVALPNGVMAAYRGRELCFCEPFRPHAWPEKYRQTMDFPIMGLGAIGSALVVTTTGNPYFVTGSHPSSMRAEKAEQNLPCINKRGVVDLGFAICYPSHEGLVAAGGGGSFDVVSANLFNRDAWLKHSPSTFVAGQISRRYVAFYDTVVAGQTLSGALFIDIGQTPFLIRSSVRASAVFYDLTSGALYYIEKGTDDVFRFDAPDGAREKLYWRSKEFELAVPDNFGAMIVKADVTLTGQEQANLDALVAAVKAANAALIAAGSILGDLNAAPINSYALGGDNLAAIPQLSGVLSVGVFADNKKVVTVSRTNAPVRLPGGFAATKWEVDVSGDIQIHHIALARTMDELKEVAA